MSYIHEQKDFLGSFCSHATRIQHTSLFRSHVYRQNCEHMALNTSKTHVSYSKLLNLVRQLTPSPLIRSLFCLLNVPKL